VITPVLSQDVKGTTAEAESMTFRTLKGFNGSGVTFESVRYPGYYLTSKSGVLSMTQDPSDKDATFFVSTDTLNTQFLNIHFPSCHIIMEEKLL